MSEDVDKHCACIFDGETQISWCAKHSDMKRLLQDWIAYQTFGIGTEGELIERSRRLTR